MHGPAMQQLTDKLDWVDKFLAVGRDTATKAKEEHERWVLASVPFLSLLHSPMAAAGALGGWVTLWRWGETRSQRPSRSTSSGWVDGPRRLARGPYQEGRKK